MNTAFEYRVVKWRGHNLIMVELDLIVWGSKGYRLVSVTDVQADDVYPPEREITAFLERVYDPTVEQVDLSRFEALAEQLGEQHE